MERWILVLKDLDRNLIEWTRLLIGWRSGPRRAVVKDGLPKSVVKAVREAFRVEEECGDDCLLVVGSPPEESSGSMGEGLYILVDGRVAAYISREAVPKILSLIHI